MSYITIDCSNGGEVLEQLHNFLVVGKYSNIEYKNCSGSVFIDDCLGTSSTINELYSIVFSSSTNYSVSAQHSGVIGSGVVGTKFIHSKITFTITAPSSVEGLGLVDCSIGDTIYIQMTSPWKSVSRSIGNSYIWCAPGNDDLRKIYVGLSSFSNPTGGFMNARVIGYPLYNENKNEGWNKNDSKVWPLGPDTGQACTLFAKADGMFCYAVCKIGTVYTSCCFGFIDMINTYEEHFCPMFLGGSATISTAAQELTSSAWKWTHSSIRSPILGTPQTSVSRSACQQHLLYSDHNATFFTKFNMWEGVSRVNLSRGYSYYEFVMDNYNYATPFLTNNLDGTYPLFPVTMHRDMNSTDDSSVSEIGYTIPFVGFSSNMNNDNVMVVPETKIRDKTNRHKYMFVSNGYVVDQYNFYCVRVN